MNLPPDVLKQLETRIADAEKNGLAATGVRYEDEAGKIVDVDPKEVFKTLRAGVVCEQARQAHNVGALHHQLWAKMGKHEGTSPEALLEEVNTDIKSFRMDRGQTKIVEKELSESAVDLVHAWRDPGRGYKTGMSWEAINDRITNGKFSPIQEQYLRQSVHDLQNAERAGIVGTNPADSAMWRLRARWAYAGAAAVSKIRQ